MLKHETRYASIKEMTLNTEKKTAGEKVVKYVFGVPIKYG